MIEQLNTLNLRFEGGEVLHDEELNLIVSHINEVVSNINTNIIPAIENGIAGKDGELGAEGPAGNDGVDGISSLNAFVGALNVLDALEKLGDRMLEKYPPGKYSIDSNVLMNPGEVLFMTSARRQGEFNYLFGSDNQIWGVPVQLGIGGTTSTTGVDTDEINYIYCRTTKGIDASSLYNPLTTNWVNILDNVELNPGSGVKVINNLTNIITLIANESIANINGAWTDHPYGINTVFPHEWMVGLKKNSLNEWEYYFGPIMISNFGYNGLDGDGLEYIFTLVLRGESAPTLTTPYSGYIGETLYLNVSIASDTYLNDDFIPEGWNDEPLTPTLEYPNLYVSIRKKEETLEISKKKWGAFITPKLWNSFNSPSYSIQLSKNNFLFKTNNTNSEIEIGTLTRLLVFEGYEDIIGTNAFRIVLNISFTGGVDSYLGLATISEFSLENNTITKYTLSDGSTNAVGEDIEINRQLYNDGFYTCLYKLNNSDLPTLLGNIQYTLKFFSDSNRSVPLFTISKELSLLIVSAGSYGTIYMLEVDPPIISYEVDFAGNISWNPQTVSLRLKLTIGGTTTVLNSVPEGMSLYMLQDSETESIASLNLNLSSSAIAIKSNNNTIANKITYKLYNSNNNLGDIISLASIITNRKYLRMIIPQGTYQDKLYTATETTVPLVYYKDEDNEGYYYLIGDNNEMSANDYADPPNSLYWAVATDLYEVVLTKALFALFANLGSFIIYENYLFSLYGELYRYNDDTTVDTTVVDANYIISPKDKVPYAYFDPNDPYASNLNSDNPIKFRPKKLINALTGEEWMAGGKIKISSDGNLEIKGATMIDRVVILKEKGYELDGANLRSCEVEYYLFNVEKGEIYSEIGHVEGEGDYYRAKNLSFKCNRLYICSEGICNQGEFSLQKIDKSKITIILPPPHHFIGLSIVIINKAYGFKEGNIVLKLIYCKLDGTDFICLTHEKLIDDPENPVYIYKDKTISLENCAPYDNTGEGYALLSGILLLEKQTKKTSNGQSFTYMMRVAKKELVLDDYEWIELTAMDGWYERLQSGQIDPDPTVEEYSAVWLVTRYLRRKEIQTLQNLVANIELQLNGQ